MPPHQVSASPFHPLSALLLQSQVYIIVSKLSGAGMGHVLIIDDEEDMAQMLSGMVRQMGHEPDCASLLQSGLAKALAGTYDVVLLDVHLPDGNGLEILPELLRTPSSPEVIIVTGYGDPDGAEVAVESGAWDYLEKPVSQSRMALSLNRVFQYRDNLKKRPVTPVTLKIEGVIGSSHQMKACVDLVARAACSDANVLISGETGSGKELMAKAIHYSSPRAPKSLIVVDCAALPETLVESALFGHEKGSFTGADRSKDGLIKQADGGTLFLDEIGELSLSIQKTFLRVLQERRFRPVGGRQEVKSDFRLVAATNRDLGRMVEEGLFRADLLFRIHSISIELPPLRTRPEDIKELVFYYMNRLCENYEIETKGFSPDFMDALMSYEWPGNVRELMNTLDRTLSLARHEPILFAKHLPVNIRARAIRSSVSSVKNQPQSGIVGHQDMTKQEDGRPEGLPAFRDLRKAVLEKAEREYLQDLVALTRGNLKEAGRISGLGRTQLFMLLKKHGISRLGW
jgi:two-component system, NtrC family, response regulator